MKIKIILVFCLMIAKNLFSGETPSEKRKGTPFQKEERTFEIEQYEQQIEEQKRIKKDISTDLDKALIHQRRKNYDEAEKIYRKLVKKHPENLDYKYRLGKILTIQKEWIEAENIFLECISKKPGFNKARFYLAYCYFHQKKISLAQKELNYLEKQIPNDVDIRILQGRIYSYENNYKMAENEYKKALKIKPDNPEALIALGRLKYVHKRYKSAKFYISKARKERPKDLFLQEFWGNLKPYVNPTFKILILEAQDRSNDLVLKIRTTQVNSFVSSLTFNYPINNRISFRGNYTYYPERQINLVLGWNNYFVNKNYYSVGFDANFKKYSSLIGSLTFTRGDERGSKNLFPFMNKTMIEPLINYKYFHDNDLFVATMSKDSFITKAVIYDYAYFIERYKLFSLYERHFFNHHLAIGGRGGISEYKGSYDDNTKYETEIWSLLNFDIFKFNIIGMYKYAYRAMDRLNFDYESYKYEKDNVIEISLTKRWIPNSLFRITYTHIWKLQKDLTNESREIISPETIPQVLPLHKYTGNTIDALLRVYHKAFLSLDLNGMYYKNTDKTEAWTFKATLSLLF